MDEKELNKKLDCFISKALEVIGKKAIEDFEVVGAAKLTQDMDPPHAIPGAKNTI